eukprot:TRINITY_DN6540_c0_g1_i3.p1 TRINITY_DN6540_c0_g1~~TRINITY_DN6540_c0_g1_i3.p1  ORF type:complete len:366 (+),score=52.07 TRINITY_DN6540_c0_g1_i3:69-1166(+)
MCGRTLIRISNTKRDRMNAASHGNRSCLFNHKLYSAVDNRLFCTQIDPTLVSLHSEASSSKWDDVMNLLETQYTQSILHSDFHRGAIQSLTIAGNAVLSASDDGQIVSFPLEIDETMTDSQSPTIRVAAGERSGHRGWTGVAVNPSNSAELATARYFTRQVRVFDKDILSREIYSSAPPSSICYVQGPGSSPLVCLTEGNICSIWDLRSSESSGCVHRLQPTVANLYSSAALANQLGVVGADRTVHVYDIRKWTIAGRWTGCLKYAANNIQFNTADPSLCIVSGYDHEVACGRWDGNTKVVKPFSIRADSRWLGFSSDGNQGAGFCDSGAVYFVPNLSPTNPKANLDGADADVPNVSKRTRLCEA